MKSLYLLTSFYFMILLWGGVSFAQTQKENCDFISRSANQDLLSALPTNVIGWVNCRPARLDTNIFIVAKLKKSESQDLTSYLLNYAKTIVASGQKHRLVQEKKDARGVRELLIETTRINDLEPMIHYAIAVPGGTDTVFVFIHSMGQQDHRLTGPHLNRARLLLSGPALLATLN